MLSIADIDALMNEIKTNGFAMIYYVAHMIEGRETNILDEHTYKSISNFKIVRLKLTGINNAYFEYMEYEKAKKDGTVDDKYHTETEVCYYCPIKRYIDHTSIMEEQPKAKEPEDEYIHYFITKNVEEPFSKEFNSRIPSIIYGLTQEKVNRVYKVETYTSPSPVKAEYTNVLSYNGAVYTSIGDLSWKYRSVKDYTNEDTIVVDGNEYKYVTSDWYILDVDNFPMVEKPLIVAGENSGYFRSLSDACYYIDQLIA